MLQPKKHNRPDTPLASTPEPTFASSMPISEPIGLKQERERQNSESIKGGYFNSKKEKDSVSTKKDVMKDAGERLKNNQI